MAPKQIPGPPPSRGRATFLMCPCQQRAMGTRQCAVFFAFIYYLYKISLNFAPSRKQQLPVNLPFVFYFVTSCTLRGFIIFPKITKMELLFYKTLGTT